MFCFDCRTDLICSQKFPPPIDAFLPAEGSRLMFPRHPSWPLEELREKRHSSNKLAGRNGKICGPRKVVLPQLAPNSLRNDQMLPTANQCDFTRHKRESTAHYGTTLGSHVGSLIKARRLVKSRTTATKEQELGALAGRYLRSFGTSKMPESAARAAAMALWGSALASTASAAGRKNSFTLSSMLSRRRATCLAEAAMTSLGPGGPMIWRFCICMHPVTCERSASDAWCAGSRMHLHMGAHTDRCTYVIFEGTGAHVCGHKQVDVHAHARTPRLLSP